MGEGYTSSAPLYTQQVDSAGGKVVPSTQGSASIAAGQATAGTTASSMVAARSNRRSVTFTNHGTTAVLLGPAGVMATTGALLAGVIGAQVTLQTAAQVFGITASGTQIISFLETF